MKFTTLSLAAAALSMPSWLLAAEGSPSTSFDFDRINATIQDGLEPALALSDTITTFTYAFDAAQTDVDADRYASNMRIAGKAPWAAAGFDASGHFIIDHDPQGSAGVFNVDLDATIETDTLAALRFLAANTTACPVAARLTGVLRVAVSQDCKIAPKLAQVTSFDALYDILREHIDDSVVALTAFRADLQRAALAASTDALKHTLSSQLAETDSVLQATRNAQLIRTADGVKAVVGSFMLFGIFHSESMTLDFQPASMHIDADIMIHAGSSIYRAAKPELVQLLRDMETGEDYTKRFIQMEMRFWLRLFDL